MKKTVFIMIVIMAAFQTVGYSQNKRDLSNTKRDTVSADSIEYRLIVFDPGFDAWIATQPPKDFYSQSYYEQKNRIYVTEWNMRYLTSRNSGMFENYIEYDPRTDYGLDINYKLYYYFRYFEKKNRIKLSQAN